MVLRKTIQNAASDQGPHCLTLNQQFTVTSIGSKMFVCVEVLRPSQPNGVMSSTQKLTTALFEAAKLIACVGV